MHHQCHCKWTKQAKEEHTALGKCADPAVKKKMEQVLKVGYIDDLSHSQNGLLDGWEELTVPIHNNDLHHSLKTLLLLGL